MAVEPATFAASYWGRRPLHTPAAALGGEGFADLLDLDAVDELVSRRGLRTPFLRVAKDGQVLPTRRFTGSGGAGATVGDQVVDDRVLDLFLDGATLVLQGLHRMWPPLIDFAGQLRSDLGHPVQVNAYVTPASSQGFAAHYDVHDVFVLQVAGDKAWQVHAPVLPDPLPDQPWTDRRADVAAAARGQPLLDVVLRPGDTLYLPRGFLHAARARGEVSAHLTVGVPPVSRYALVEALLGLAADDPALRASLPLGVEATDPGALAESLEQTVKALVDRLQRAHAVEVADRLAATLLPLGRPAPLAPLAHAAGLAAVSEDTVVRLRPHLPLAVRDAGSPGGGVVLVLADRRVPLAESERDAVDVLRGGGAVRVGDLPGAGPEARLELARRLLREAVLVPVGPPAGPGAG